MGETNKPNGGSSQAEKIDWLCDQVAELHDAIYKGNKAVGQPILSRIVRLEVMAGLALFLAGAALAASLPEIIKVIAEG